jgi:hypothetical protein
MNKRNLVKGRFPNKQKTKDDSLSTGYPPKQKEKKKNRGQFWTNYINACTLEKERERKRKGKTKLDQMQQEV